MSVQPKAIDLRSDTVTRPTRAMLDAMMRAPLGDDVLGDDPSVQLLEQRFAELMGKEAACFVPSGTMGNQASIKAHTRPGDEILAHEHSHIILYEGGGPAALSGCMVRGLTGRRGQFTPMDIDAAIRPDNTHFPRSSLLVVENTHNKGGGSVWSLEDVRGVTGAARRAGLRTHLDGARLWNACAASGLAPKDYAMLFDSVTCCFSKGLGAPVGSAIAGDAPFIKDVRRARKLLGGGMRQSGLLASACLFAMENHVSRLRDDHENARRLAEHIARSPLLRLDPQHDAKGVETNIVLIEIAPEATFDAAGFCERLSRRGVLMLPTGARTVRAVTHLDVTRDSLDRAGEIIDDLMRSNC
jgi:threonine aldolase